MILYTILTEIAFPFVEQIFSLRSPQIVGEINKKNYDIK